MKKYYLLLFLIFLIGYLLRVMYLPQKSLTFGYDQARDIVRAKEIMQGDLKIQGPPTSGYVTNHGVLWYYFLVPPVFLSGGNPIVSAYWSALFNCFTILTVYVLTYKFTKKKSTSLIASIIYGISFEATQYATWLSNPTLATSTVPLMYLGLWIWITESKRRFMAPVLTGLMLGLSTQAAAFLFYHLVPIFILLVLGRKNISMIEVVLFVLSFITSVSTMILSEIKFGLGGIDGALSLLAGHDTEVISRRFGDFLLLYLNQIGDVFSNNTIPFNSFYGGIFVCTLLVYSLILWNRKKRNSTNQLISWELFITTWIVSSMTVVSLGGVSTPHLTAGIGSAVCILVAIVICNWWSVNKLLSATVLMVVVAANLNAITRYGSNGQVLFAIQDGMLLKKQIETMDYTYDEANDEPFNINALTSPLDTNIVWAYLYKWYGQNKYGYTPSWNGPSQVGQIIALDEGENTDLHYLIIEPMDGIPQQYLSLKIGEEDESSTVVGEKSFGSIVVQKRSSNE